jgi:hypothetical protein
MAKVMASDGVSSGSTIGSATDTRIALSWHTRQDLAPLLFDDDDKAASAHPGTSGGGLLWIRKFGRMRA